MNRRSLLTFLAAIPFVGSAVAKPASAHTCSECEKLKAELASYQIAELVEPDFHLLYGTPVQSFDFVPDDRKEECEFAMVTDEPRFTRAAVKDGWIKADRREHTHYSTNTGLPCSIFVRLRT